MIRKLLFVVATGFCLIGPSAAPAHAAGTVVVVDSPPPGSAPSYGGTLTRSAPPSPVGFLAVYGGLSVLGFTLAAISRQRRSAMRALAPSGAGVAYGQRSWADFWGPAGAERTATTVASTRPVLRTGPLPWARAGDRQPVRRTAGVAPRSPGSATG